MRDAPILLPAFTIADEFRSHARYLARDNRANAEDEIQRLSGLFDGLSKTLCQDAPLDLKNRAGSFQTPAALMALFRRAANDMRHTTLSQPVILPADIYHGEIGYALKRESATQFGLGGNPLVFDFHQVMSKNFIGREVSSTSFPVLGLGRIALDTISTFKPEGLLTALQDLMTIINHDPLHHVTSPLINNKFAKKFTGDRSLDDLPIRQWYKKYTPVSSRFDTDAQIQGYESFLILYQAHILRHSLGGDDGAFTSYVDHYFDELDRIAEELRAVPDQEAAAKAIDYFGMVMAGTLTRFLPLDHPTMSQCLARMEKLDPGLPADRSFVDRLALRFERESGSKNGTQTTRNYDAAGKGYLPGHFDKGSSTPSYADLKKIQLTLLQPWLTYLHSPSQSDPYLKPLQDRVPAVGYEMIVAAEASFAP